MRWTLTVVLVALLTAPALAQSPAASAEVLRRLDSPANRTYAVSVPAPGATFYIAKSDGGRLAPFWPSRPLNCCSFYRTWIGHTNFRPAPTRHASRPNRDTPSPTRAGRKNPWRVR